MIPHEKHEPHETQRFGNEPAKSIIPVFERLSCGRNTGGLKDDSHADEVFAVFTVVRRESGLA
jgi:hypothetical protein